MAINVQIRCSDCGELSDRTINSTDTEIICPECQRNMPNLSREEFNAVEKTLGTQKLLGILSILFVVGAAGLLVLYMGDPSGWVSGKGKTVDAMFLYGAGACILLGAILGTLSARRRYVVEF
jgi:phage FluMu protein Com